MRLTLPEKVEDGRITRGTMASDVSHGPNGAFRVYGPCGTLLLIIASDGFVEGSDGWEHVSASTQKRTPNWQEMCWIKDQFFQDEECVVQFHPPQSDYVNNHPHCLHLWRHALHSFPRPPSILVGIKAEGVMTPERAQEINRTMGR